MGDRAEVLGELAPDQEWMASAEAAEQRYRNRYSPGERMYVDQVPPPTAHTSWSTRGPGPPDPHP